MTRMFPLLCIVACFVICSNGGIPAFAADFYVAPNGSDNAVGTKSSPFASLEKARDSIREGRKTGVLKPDEPVTVRFAPGRYYLKGEFQLEKEDGGTEKGMVTYRSEEPFGAEWIGGFAVPETSFQAVADPKIRERLNEAVRDKVLVADLDSLKIPKMKKWSKDFRGVVNTPPELFFNAEPMTLARWPNEGWAGFKTAIDTGMPHDEKTAETNRQRAEKAGIEFVHPDADTTKRHGGTLLYDQEGLQLRDPERFARWKVEDGVWLCGYWTHDWANATLQVASIDTKNKTLTFRGVHDYGILGRQSWAGFSERRYFALNLLEELDAPGEWYLDRDANRLYFYPPAELKGASIVLSTLETPVVRLKETEFVRLEGLSIGPTFGNGIEIVGGTNNAVLGCRIRNTATGGIRIGGGTEHTIRSCDLYNIGASGVSVTAGDRATLTPAGHRVENNHIYRFGRNQRTYAGAVGLSGVGITVRNNRMHDAPHLAISYSGNEHRIERNEIFDVVRETSDAGAIYSGRDWTMRGTVIRENYIHRLGSPASHGTMGVYLDDCTCGHTVRRNVFYKASRAVFIGGGRDNVAENNLFVDCFQGIALDSRGLRWKEWNTPGNGWNLEEKAEKLNYRNPPWSERYPKLAVIMQNEPRAPLGCVFRRNVMIDCKNWMRLDDGVLGIMKRADLNDNIVVADNLVVENEVETAGLKLPEKDKSAQKFVKNVAPDFIGGEKNDFRFKPDSPLLKMLPDGFEPIPFEKIGLYVDEYRKSIP